VANIPTFFNNLAVTPLVLGPFQIDLTHLNMSTVGEQLLGIVQPLLTQVGSLVGSVASSTASVIGWIFFCMIVSYFVLVETGGARERILNFQLPGYQADFARIGSELSRIWNAYLRGQTLIIVITMFGLYCAAWGMGRSVLHWVSFACMCCPVCPVCRSLCCVDNLWSGRIFSGHDAIWYATVDLRPGGYRFCPCD